MAHWNLDNLRETALHYESKTEFAKANPAAYRAAKRMVEKVGADADAHIFGHMPKQATYKQKWTYPVILDMARSYNCFTEFKNNCNGAYQKIIRSSWQSKLFSDMPFEWCDTAKAQEMKLISVG